MSLKIPSDTHIAVATSYLIDNHSRLFKAKDVKFIELTPTHKLGDAVYSYASLPVRPLDYYDTFMNPTFSHSMNAEVYAFLLDKHVTSTINISDMYDGPAHQEALNQMVAHRLAQEIIRPLDLLASKIRNRPNQERPALFAGKVVKVHSDYNVQTLAYSIRYTYLFGYDNFAAEVDTAQKLTEQVNLYTQQQEFKARPRQPIKVKSAMIVRKVMW